jgi:hypothetical protein
MEESFLYVFTYSLFNNSISSLSYIILLMITELEREWKELVVAWFDVLFWHLPRGTEESDKNPVGIGGLWAETWTWDLMTTVLECYLLGHDV